VAPSPTTASPTTPLTHNLLMRALGLLLISAAIAVIAVKSSASRDTSEVIFLVSLIFAYAGSRTTSPVLRVYVVFVALWFFLPSLFGLDTGQPQLTQVYLIVALWLFAWTGGQLVFDRLDHVASEAKQPGYLRDREALIGLMAIGSVAMLIQAKQIAEGIRAYTLQISGVTDTSLSGDIATTAGPALIAAFIIAQRSSSRRVKTIILLLMVIEAIFLTQNGFRSSAVDFEAAGFIAYIAVYPPSTSRARRALAGWLLIAVVLGLPLLLIASNIRQTAQFGTSRNSLTFASLPQAISGRLDETANLGQALGPLNPQARSVVAMTHQLEILVPRPLWPDKPIFNYGEQVSSAIYGIPASYKTASTITWLGDLYLNDGPWGILVSGIILGSLLRRVLRRAVRGSTLMIVVTVPLVTALFNAESTIILGIAGMLQTVILLTLACLIARSLSPILLGGRLSQ